MALEREATPFLSSEEQDEYFKTICDSREELCQLISLKSALSNGTLFNDGNSLYLPCLISIVLNVEDTAMRKKGIFRGSVSLEDFFKCRYKFSNIVSSISF